MKLKNARIYVGIILTSHNKHIRKEVTKGKLFTGVI
jgi:hypothetical protein